MHCYNWNRNTNMVRLHVWSCVDCKWPVRREHSHGITYEVLCMYQTSILFQGFIFIGYSSRNSTSTHQYYSLNRVSLKMRLALEPLLCTCQPLTSKRWVLGWGCPSVHMHLRWRRSWLWSSCPAACCCQFLQVPPSYLAGDWTGRSGCLAPHRNTDIGLQLPPTLQASEGEQGGTKW